MSQTEPCLACRYAAHLPACPGCGQSATCAPRSPSKVAVVGAAFAASAGLLAQLGVLTQISR